MPSLWAFLAHFATSTRHVSDHVRVHEDYNEMRTVVAEMAVQDSGQHERLMEKGVNALLVRNNTDNAVLREGPRAWMSDI